MPALLQRRVSLELCLSIAPVVLLACVEVITLGIPLGYLNADWMNFSLAFEDSPAVTITNRSIMIESAGIMLAFPLACLIAGCLAVKYRPLNNPAAAASQDDAWLPAPRAL